VNLFHGIFHDMMHLRTRKYVETLKTVIKCTYFYCESNTDYVSTLREKMQFPF